MKKISKLLDVKSLVTLTLTIIFGVLAIRRDISAEQYLTVYTVVISFYFGVQYEKHRNKIENKEEGDINDD